MIAARRREKTYRARTVKDEGCEGVFFKYGQRQQKPHESNQNKTFL